MANLIFWVLAIRFLEILKYSATSVHQVIFILTLGRRNSAQKGGSCSFDNGVRYLDYFGTDYKRNAYIMRVGETSVPASLQHAYDRAIKAQQIIRQNIKVGRTAGQTLQNLISALEAADYIYRPFTDESPENYMNVQKKLANTDKSSFSIRQTNEFC